MTAPRITTDNRHPVAVYGTLRPGFGNDRLWHGQADCAADLVAYVDGYKLTTFGPGGGFPYASPEPDSRITVNLVFPFLERYEHVLREMDYLEGAYEDGSGHYDRIAVTAYTAEGQSITAWLYAVPETPARAAYPVDGNDWAAFKAASHVAPPPEWDEDEEEGDPEAEYEEDDYEPASCPNCGKVEHSPEELTVCLAALDESGESPVTEDGRCGWCGDEWARHSEEEKAECWAEWANAPQAERLPLDLGVWK